MAIMTITEKDRTIKNSDEIVACLKTYDIDYERWAPAHSVADDAPAEEILRAYAKEVDELKSRGGYVTADVIDVGPGKPGLDAVLAKFNREHWHDEDEGRFINARGGLFYIYTQGRPGVAIEVEAGDLIRVPRGTRHWFNLCADKRIRAIRLFQDVSGWTPLYTESGVDEGFLPVCLGVTHLPLNAAG